MISIPVYKNKNIKPILSLFCVTIAVLSFLTSCAQPEPEVISVNKLMFDTVINISVYEYPSGSSTRIREQCEDICSHYDKLLSPENPDSDIYRINHADAFPVKIDPDTAEAIELGIGYGQMSDGLIDITAGRLIELWDIRDRAISGEGVMSEMMDITNMSDIQNPQDIKHNQAASDASDKSVIPNEDQIRSALATVDYRNIELTKENDGSCYLTLKDPDARLELGCIGKGLIADKLEKALRENGVTSAIINLGGNVTIIGRKPGNMPFKVGIQYPFKARGETITVVEAEDISVVSSGIYERYFKEDDKIYHHIFDLRTGYPADSGILGVTVRCPSSADADALSTLCLILGIDEGIRLAEAKPDTEVMFIDSDYNIITSSGW